MSSNAIREEITLDTIVSTKELSIILGLTTRRVQQLVQDGQFEAVKRGRFNLAKCVSRYMDLITKEKSASEKEKEAADLTIKKAKAVVAALEAKELQGKMHRSDDIEAITEDLVYTIRGLLLALPGRLAVDVVNASNSAEAAEIIKREVYIIMGELSNYQYDPAKYEERVRERRKWSRIENGDFDEEDE